MENKYDARTMLEPVPFWQLPLLFPKQFEFRTEHSLGECVQLITTLNMPNNNWNNRFNSHMEVVIAERQLDVYDFAIMGIGKNKLPYSEAEGILLKDDTGTIVWGRVIFAPDLFARLVIYVLLMPCFFLIVSGFIFFIMMALVFLSLLLGAWIGCFRAQRHLIIAIQELLDGKIEE